MLAPETRVMLTDALRPPDGHRVDVAVATTYSLDLTALLLAPLSFALFDQTASDDVAAVDPIRLLEAVRRHSEHTTVFCQAGAIAVPSNYRSILTFVEESVREVMPPTEGRVFHPKVWVMRFVDPDGGYLHRFVCLSRNLTFDRSWDTALRLDEDPDSSAAVDPQPLREFLTTLPTLSVKKLSDERQAQITSLAETISSARLVPPAPFTAVTLLPLGLGPAAWPFPEKAERLLAIAPFVDKSTLRNLGGICGKKTIVSRPESLDRLGLRATEGWQTQCLQRLVEVAIGDDVDPAPAAVSEWDRQPEGLHAKTFVCDVGRDSVVVTGSANLTGAAWHGNVEFDVVMTGPRRECGVTAILDGRTDAPGLSRMLEDYQPADADGKADAAQETSWALELFHQRLAASAPELRITRIDDERVTATLLLAATEADPGKTTVWPVSLSKDTAGRAFEPGTDLTWSAFSPRNVTPFVAIETTAGDGESRTTRRCVIEATLVGDIDQRRRDAVAEVLRNRDDVLRYLVFLLGDPSYDALFEQLSGAG